MNRKRFSIFAGDQVIGALCFLSMPLWAGPPIDVVVPESTPVPRSRLNENDLVYTNNLSNQKVTGETTTTIRIAKVSGRNLPGRKGKELAVLLKGDKVGLLQLSKDNTWRAVYSFKHSRKLWVPVAALNPLPDKKENPPAVSVKESKAPDQIPQKTEVKLLEE
jgi:hypothetical protein